MSNEIVAPWDDHTVQCLNKFQHGPMHPFTCGFDTRHVLVATNDGWVCPFDDYRQNWAMKWMTEPAAYENPEWMKR